MYKILTFIITFILFIGVTHAYSQTDLDNAASKGYILSDQFGSNSECISIRITNDSNPAYSGRNRTECFNVGTSYYYLIGGEGFSVDLSVIFLSNSGVDAEQSYNELYGSLTDVDKLDNLSIDDLVKMKESILANSSLSEAEKALLIGLIDNGLNTKIEDNLSNSSYISKLSLDDLDKLKTRVENNTSLSQSEKDKLLGLIDNEINKRAGLITDLSIEVLDKIGVNPSSDTIFYDLKDAFNSGKLDILSAEELQALSDWIIINPDLTGEEKAELLKLLELKKSSLNSNGSAFDKIGVDSDSIDLYDDILSAINNSKLDLLNSGELSDLKSLILINPNINGEEKAILLLKIDGYIEENGGDDSIMDLISGIADGNNTTTTNTTTTTSGGSRTNYNSTIEEEEEEEEEEEVENIDEVVLSYLDLFNKYDIDAGSSSLFLDLIKLIESGDLSSIESETLLSFINKTRLLNDTQKTHLIGLFTNCTTDQKKALKFIGNEKKVICIDKTIRTCRANNVNYVPFSMDGGIVKLYDDRFFEKRTGLYYWKCLDDSRFQKVKALVCLNGYEMYGTKCKNEATVEYKKEKCSSQCNTTYLGQKLYYNFADDNKCECIYYKDNNTSNPGYVISTDWSEKNRIWLRSSSSSSSSSTSNNININTESESSSESNDGSISDFLNELFN